MMMIQYVLTGKQLPLHRGHLHPKAEAQAHACPNPNNPIANLLRGVLAPSQPPAELPGEMATSSLGEGPPEVFLLTLALPPGTLNLRCWPLMSAVTSSSPLLRS